MARRREESVVWSSLAPLRWLAFICALLAAGMLVAVSGLVRPADWRFILAFALFSFCVWHLFFVAHRSRDAELKTESQLRKLGVELAVMDREYLILRMALERLAYQHFQQGCSIEEFSPENGSLPFPWTQKEFHRWVRQYLARQCFLAHAQVVIANGLSAKNVQAAIEVLAKAVAEHRKMVISSTDGPPPSEQAIIWTQDLPSDLQE